MTAGEVSRNRQGGKIYDKGHDGAQNQGAALQPQTKKTGDFSDEQNTGGHDSKCNQ